MKLHKIKLRVPIILSLSIFLFFSYSCKSSKEKDKAPTCTISYPDNSEEIQQGKTISFSANADDIDGNIIAVDFFVDGSSVGSSSSFPYIYVWNTSGVEIGHHTLKATAKDNDGSSTSDEISVVVTKRTEETGTVTDYDGNVYKTVTIGNQTWMAENLKVTHYPNGKPIPLVNAYNLWPKLGDNDTDDAYCYYNNNANGEVNTYGALYTWAAAMNGSVSSDSTPSGVQGVCPDGWHLPSYNEWIKLSDFVGYPDNGFALKATTGWESNGNGTDNYGFTALPGGRRKAEDGYFEVVGYDGFWWNASDSYCDAFLLTYYDQFIQVGNFDKSNGFSVRCVKN